MRIEIVDTAGDVRGWIQVDGPTVTHDELGGELLDQPALREFTDLTDAQIAQTLTTWSNGYDLHARVVDDHPVAAALGHDVTPGHDELHHYWTRGPGLAKWIGSRHQFETLRDHLLRFPFFAEDPERANKAAAAWVHEVTGFWPGSDMHRVLEGHKPRGKHIGPG